MTLFAQIEAKQHEGLRAMAFEEWRSLADMVREALTEYLARRRGRGAARAVTAAGKW